MKKVLIFTGAGVSAESGIETFRDSGGLWSKYRVEDVATPNGWRKDRDKVLKFYNERRSQLKSVNPNLAHEIIAELEQDFHVTVVTQNVDNLHERAGSTNVIHMHGELTKVRSTLNPKYVYDCEGDCNIGDKCELGSQLRPHVVWFGEDLDREVIDAANRAAFDCDFCVVVGTSMKVAPANQIPILTPLNTLIFVVEPNELDFYLDKQRRPFLVHIKDVATTGMEKVKDELYKIIDE